MARYRIWSNTAEYLSLGAIERLEMAELHRYWDSFVVDGRPPLQKDLSVHEMPECLANIALLDVSVPQQEHRDVPDGFPLRARYLMVGDALKSLLGENPTGRLVSDVYKRGVAIEVSRALAKAMDTRGALYYRREFQILTKSFGYDRLILPMRLQGEDVRRILLCIYPLSDRLVSAEQWRSELAKVEDMETAEARVASAWAESLGYRG
jgi:hypothetical protein